MRARRDLERAAPDVAQAGRRLLQDPDNRPGVAFLATVSRHGRPRLHPFVPTIVDGALYAFIIPSRKRRDPDRTGEDAIHSMLGPDDESFFPAARARRVTDETARAVVAAHMPYDNVDDDNVLFAFGVERALWTTWTTPTMPVHRTWTPADPR
jgi:hypothetical protein